jgi:two-component system, sensor histidine kinase
MEQRPAAPAAPAATTSTDPEAARLAIDAERLRLVCGQTVRAPLGVLVAAGFIAVMMAPHVGSGVAWGWAGAAIALWSLRAAVAARLLAKPPSGALIGRWIRLLVAAATLSGAVAGSSALFFLRAPPLEWALMTMVLCAWSAGGIAVSAALPAAFYGLVTLFLAPLAIGWLVSDMPLRVPVAGLLLFFLFYLIVSARDGAALVARALRVGFENEELARQLQLREAEARTARQRAEAANLAKSRFIAAASHDLRQPLHSLALLLDHAVRTSDDPKVTLTLRQAARSVDSLHELFTGLLDLSRLDAGSLTPEIRPIALGKLLERIDNDYRALAQDKGLRFECTATTAWASTDPVMLDRILRNLLDNAVKYTVSGGIAMQVDEGARALRVTVRDTGVGIDAADRERIFEEYFQASNPARDRARGIGLGLAIVKRLCDLLGLAIDVESAPGRGSAFTLTLERCEPPRAPDDQDAALPQHSLDALRGMVVVVVEDDAEVIDAMHTLLAGWGCRCIAAGSAAAAIAQLEAAGLEPDAIIADWRLGGPENGLQAIERLQQRFGARLAGIVTGEIDPAGLEVPAHRAVDVMRKPLRASELGQWLLQAT